MAFQPIPTPWYAMTCVVVLPRCFHGIARASSRAPTVMMVDGQKVVKLKLTKRAVESLKVKEKDYIAFDAELPGFGVRVMPSGKRFFLIQYRRHGRTRRVMIGLFGPVTAERDATRLGRRAVGAAIRRLYATPSGYRQPSRNSAKDS